MKHIYFILFILIPFQLFSQEKSPIISGVVMNDADNKVIQNVHIVNLNQVVGTTS